MLTEHGSNIDRTLLAAQGYFELGMMTESLAELASLPTDAQDRMDVMQMRMFILMREHRWRDALKLSRRVCHLSPDESPGYIHGAFCLHELGRTQEAKALLLGGPSSLLNEATYHYNLGCYDAALGNIEEAQAHLRVSFKLDKKFREFAKNDPDLKSVRDLL